MVEPAEAASPSSGSPRWARGTVVFVAAALVGGILLAGCPSVDQVTPSPSASLPSGSSATIPASSGTPSATPSDGGTAWTAFEPVAVTPEATLRAERTDIAGVFADSAFVLTTASGTAATAVASRLTSSPVVDLAVAAGADPSSATLRPTKPLTAGQAYRFDLRAADGSLSASWAFQARGPVHVASTLPGNAATSVPTTTGVELTFDQDGVADMAPFFTISPTTPGRFERHGRTQVFVPSGLRVHTVYTVTVRHGLPLSGTDLTLERDAIFRFETGGPDTPQPIRIRIGREVLQASPTERPVLGLSLDLPYVGDVQAKPPSSVGVQVYRYPSGDAAIGQLKLLLDAPHFAEWTEPLVSTSGLPRVLRFTARLQPNADGYAAVVTFPTRLASGWYLVEVGSSRRSQAILQVTSAAAWVAVLSDRTVVWVNDVVTGQPVRGADVRIHGGASLGRTDPSGLLVARTPTTLIPAGQVATDSKSGGSLLQGGPASPILDIRAPNGAEVSVPFDLGSGGTYRGEWAAYEPATPDSWWSLLASDRTLYRPSDQVMTWGLLRARADGRVPATVELRLITSTNDDLADPPAVASVTVHPNATGAFSGRLEFAGLPFGPYVLRAIVDGRVAARAWLGVDVIRKPLYQLAVTTDHRAVIVAGAGSSRRSPTDGRVQATATARFFDDRPVPTIPLRVTDEREQADNLAPTDASGQTTYTWRPYLDPNWEGERNVCLTFEPARPEEGAISAGACVLAFPSGVTLAAGATVSGRRLTISGDVHLVDLARVERRLAAGAAGDSGLQVAGRPVGAARVVAEVTELIPVRHLTGYDYDPIAKKAIPRYEFDTVRRPVRTVTSTTRSNGTFRTTVAIPNAAHEYEVVLRTVDSAGRTERHTITAGKAPTVTEIRFPEFETLVGPRELPTDYDVGDRVSLTMTDGLRPLPSGGANRYLYIVARQGLRSAAVTTSPRFVRRFAEADVPGVFIIGVRFTGRTYAPKAATWATFDPAQRRVKVTMTADRARYRPGETATVAVRTTDVQGRPVSATVILRAVDEKLFAIGAAETFDPLAGLYGREPSGIVRLTATHQAPGGGSEGEGGTTGGDGGRSDFVDTLGFRQATTDRNGQASVVFRLSDDITSWHVSASAVTASLQAGEGQLLLPVGLPFFVEATIADDYLAGDRPTILLRAYGEALKAGDRVSFTVSGATLGLSPTVLTGSAFVDVALPLSSLSVGLHALTVEATAARTGTDGRVLSDRIVRTVKVVDSRLTTMIGASVALAAGTVLPGGPDLTTYTFSDAGRARYVTLLERFAWTGGARIDQALAQAVAHDLLVDRYGRDPATLPPVDFDPGRYPIGTQESPDGSITGAGVALVPSGGPDPLLAARVAIVAPDRLDASALRSILLYIDGLASTSREVHLAVTAGLASLGVPRLAELRAAARSSDLTVREALYVALGAEASGDDATALAIEQDLLRRYGERLGGWVRLRAGTSLDDTAEATALCAMVAAGLGDPIAPAMATYVDENPARAELHVLDQVGFVERILDRTPAAAASFAYTLDGRRQVVTLAPDRVFSIELGATQRATLKLDPLTGKVEVSAAWVEPVAIGALPRDDGLTLTRTVTPAGAIPVDTVVEVELTPTFGPLAVDGCYQVVDTAPSGLAPMARTDGWVGEDGTVAPYSVIGQRVEFCASHGPTSPTPVRLRYLARVVNPGTYAWEPAIMQLAAAPGAVAIVPAERVVIDSK